MHVGLDLLFLEPGMTGGRETHVRELLAAMTAVPGRPRLTAFLNRETAAAGPGWWSEDVDSAVVLPRASARARAQWALGETVGVARAATRAGVDVLHGPANFVPVAGPFARVLTLHDLLWRRRPELVPLVMRAGTEVLVGSAARRADRVITVSKASRDDAMSELGLPAERIAVVPNGLTPLIGGDGAAARELVGAGERPIVLAVATDLPHKNLAALLDAFAVLDAAQRPVLVIAGAGTDTGALPARAAALGVTGDVRLLGAVDASLLAGLFGAAGAFVTPTLFEGFGIPVLEAMAAGVPVAASDLPVLREVAGDAAVWFAPTDPAAIAAAVSGLIRGGPDVEARVAAGRERAKRFTWEAAAVATVEVYRDVLATR